MPDDLSSNFVMIPLTGDPETMANDLIADSLPKTFLDQIDISSDQGKAHLVACLILRQQQASIEKDEVIRFVDRNRKQLEAGALEIVKLLGTGAQQMQGGSNLGVYFDYFITQVEHALARNYDKMDLKSDRLLWLLYALGLTVASGKISYADALKILNKPEHRARISPLSLGFMVKDYADTIGSASQTHVEYIMLIAEGALLIQHYPTAVMSLLLLSMLETPRDIASLQDLVKRGLAFVSTRGPIPAELEKLQRRAASRLRGEISEDDF